MVRVRWSIANFGDTAAGSPGGARRVQLVRAPIGFEATPQGLIARASRLFPLHRTLLIPQGAVRLQRGGGFYHAGGMHVASGSTVRLNNDALTSIEQALAVASRSPTPWGATR